MADIGYLALVIAFATAIYSIIAYIVGLQSRSKELVASGRGGVLAISILTSIAATVLFYLFIVGDYSVEYVYAHSSKALPFMYKIAGFWGGNEGSMLLWVWILAVYTAVLVYLSKERKDALVPWAAVILLAVVAFFLFMTAFVTNPFSKLPIPKADGYGLNPMLQNPGMIIHPITTYLGYVGFAIPFAFAMSALINRIGGSAWIKITRRWTLVTWLFLSVGIVTGMQWAYVELGWGGFWAWDPVENASLMPWLTATALLHSVMMQEKKAMMKVWNLGLVTATFVLTIFGTFLTRSGVLASVHAFSQQDRFTLSLGGVQLISLTVGSLFLIFMGLSLGLAAFLIVGRLNLLKSASDVESYVSKESSFLFNNLILVGTAFTVFWGTMWPLVSEVTVGHKIAVGQEFFNQVAGPFGLILVLLIGICPLIAWRRASISGLRDNFLLPITGALATVASLIFLGVTEIGPLLAFGSAGFVITSILLEFGRGLRVRMRYAKENLAMALWRLVTRNRRRYGGYLVHLGVVLMVVGIVGAMSYSEEITAAVRPGEQIELGAYTATFDEIILREEPHRMVVVADLTITREDGRTVGVLQPEKAYHPNSQQPTAEVSILGSLARDHYAILASDTQNIVDALNGEAPVVFQIMTNPLMAWLWIGSYFMYAGTVIAVLPQRKGRQEVEILGS